MASLVKKCIAFCYSAVYDFRGFYWYLFSTKLYGVKCLLYSGNEILLVKHTYGPEGWTFPGGKIKRGEEPKVAASREIEEELGLKIAPIFLREYTELDRRSWPTGSKILAYAADAKGQEVVIDETEIKEARWFPLNRMPLISPFAKMILADWRRGGQLSKV